MQAQPMRGYARILIALEPLPPQGCPWTTTVLTAAAGAVVWAGLIGAGYLILGLVF